MKPSRTPASNTPKARLTPFGFVKRYFVLMIAIASLVWGWVFAYNQFAYKPKYRSNALVLIKDSAITTRYVVEEERYAVQTTSSSSSNPVLNTMGLLKSTAISDALWGYFSQQHPEELAKLKIKTEDDWKAFYADGKAVVKSKNQPATDMIAISMTWGNPAVAKEGLDVVLKAFQETSRNLNRAEQKNRVEYLKQQVKQIQDKLKTLRAQKTDFKQKMKTVNLMQESGDLSRSGVELATKLNQVMASARGKDEEAARYRKMLNMSSENALKASALGMNATLSKLRDQYYELSQTYAELKTTLTEKNPKLKAVKSQMNEVEEQIKIEFRDTLGKQSSFEDALLVADTTRGTVINQMVAAEAEAIRLNVEAEVLSQRMGEIDRKIEGFPGVEEKLATMDEEERSLSNALYTLRQKELEAELKQAETLSNVFVVDAPRVPKTEKFPTQKHLMVIGGVLGLAAGLSAAILKHYWATSDESAADPFDPPDDIDMPRPRKHRPKRQLPPMPRVSRTALAHHLDSAQEEPATRFEPTPTSVPPNETPVLENETALIAEQVMLQTPFSPPKPDVTSFVEPNPSVTQVLEPPVAAVAFAEMPHGTTAADYVSAVAQEALQAKPETPVQTDPAQDLGIIQPSLPVLEAFPNIHAEGRQVSLAKPVDPESLKGLKSRLHQALNAADPRRKHS